MKPVKIPALRREDEGERGASSGLLRRRCPVRLASAAVRRDGSARALEEFSCWPMPVADCE